MALTANTYEYVNFVYEIFLFAKRIDNPWNDIELQIQFFIIRDPFLQFGNLNVIKTKIKEMIQLLLIETEQSVFWLLKHWAVFCVLLAACAGVYHYKWWTMSVPLITSRNSPKQFGLRHLNV